MKKVRLAIAVAISIFAVSCSHNVSAPAEDSFVKFNLNGSDVQYMGGLNDYMARGEGVFAQKLVVTTPANVQRIKYVIAGATGGDKQLINIPVVTDSLQAGTYISGFNDSIAVTVVKQNDIAYTKFRDTDSIVVNITRYSQGSIDGTFGGKLGNRQTVNSTVSYRDGVIKDGSFKNVKVIY